MIKPPARSHFLGYQALDYPPVGMIKHEQREEGEREAEAADDLLEIMPVLQTVQGRQLIPRHLETCVQTHVRNT